MRLPERIRRRLLGWALVRMMGSSPDFIIGDNYLLRWYVARNWRRWTPERAAEHEAAKARGENPPRRGGNVYLHEMLGDDDDRALHDHPWPSCSIILAGGYLEHVPVDRAKPDGKTIAHVRRAGDVVFRGPRAAHRLALDPSMGDRYALTLFLTGPKLRTWGFWCPFGFRPWREFVDPDNPGQPGRGCGEHE